MHSIILSTLGLHRDGYYLRPKKTQQNPDVFQLPVKLKVLLNVFLPTKTIIIFLQIRKYKMYLDLLSYNHFCTPTLIFIFL